MVYSVILEHHPLCLINYYGELDHFSGIVKA